MQKNSLLITITIVAVLVTLGSIVFLNSELQAQGNEIHAHHANFLLLNKQVMKINSELPLMHN